MKKIEQGCLLFNALPEENISEAREKVRLAIEAGSVDMGDKKKAKERKKLSELLHEFTRKQEKN